MAHLTTRSSYESLVERLNRFPQGAPPSETLHGILKLLFSEQEAGLVALLPIKPFTATQAATAWGMSNLAARKILDGLASRCVLLDAVNPNGETMYVLPPPMAGFFEFSMMRLRGDLDQHLLGELFYQYLNVEDGFITALFTTENHIGRVFVNEEALTDEHQLTILDYERASEVARTASSRSVGMCYCRHKMSHVGRACDAPMDICLTFNGVSSSLARHGYAREIDVSEALDKLQQARDVGLVQCGENQQQGVNFICNCCGCCCEALVAARKVGFTRAVATTNYMPVVDENRCNGCGKCVNACPVEAMALLSANNPRYPKLRKAMVNMQVCLGCGVCVRACTRDAMHLDAREQRVITPIDSVHRTVLLAIEKGMLAELIFDNQAFASHRMMAAILGVILHLPPLKRTLASAQFQSRYLVRLIEWAEKRM
ncbi:MAG TPA: 4Fe-4S dicluster domain-containing protein [Anaerolineae bacterium]